MQNKKVKLLLNRPIVTGMTVLELSKLQLYSFHNDFILKLYPSRCLLLMTDTDSLFYEFEGIPDMYKLMEQHLHLFDTSSYPKDHSEKKIRKLLENEG